jgi:hypothetical protein
MNVCTTHQPHHPYRYLWAVHDVGYGLPILLVRRCSSQGPAGSLRLVRYPRLLSARSMRGWMDPSARAERIVRG